MPHVSEQEMDNVLAAAGDAVEIGARYTHYKSEEKEYEVTSFCIIESDDSVGVLYKALYGRGFLFMRPLSGFTANVEHEGRTVARFKKVS